MSDGDCSGPSPSETELRAGLEWLSGGAQPETKNVFEWLWESIQGDFNESRSTAQVAFDAAISMIPVVDQLCDVRDLIANCKGIHQAKPEDDNTWRYVTLALTLIGLFPVLGSLVKGVLKIFFLFIRRHGLDQAGRAMDEAMTWVITLLRKREVQRYLPSRQIDEVFGWLAQQIRTVKGQVNVGSLLAAFDRGIAVLKSLVSKVDWMPGPLGSRAGNTVAMLESVRNTANAGLGKALQPVHALLERIARHLELERLSYRRGIVDTQNVHFRGGLPEARAVTLMREANPPPSWMSRGTELQFPPANPKDYANVVSEAAQNGYPKLNDEKIMSFHRLAPHDILGPARLYRITSPSNGAAGDYWMSEEVFNRLMNSPDPKAAFRKHLAVWPDWNPNGQFVLMEIPPGQTVKTWRGQTAGQIKDPLKHRLDAHLEGGWEQLLMQPAKSEWDTTRYFAKPTGSSLALQPPGISRDQWQGLPAAERDGYLGLREKINDPRIKGPFDTGWGSTDFDAQLQDVKIGIPALPGQLTAI